MFKPDFEDFKNKIKYAEENIEMLFDRHYNSAIDIHKDWEPKDEWVILNNKKTVHLSSVFYFNENYSGGDLVFYNNNKEKYFFIKPKKNCVILFDALQAHSTIPIISGVKYSYTNFYTLGERYDL